MKRTVFIVEDHELVRESYIALLAREEALAVCGAVATSEEALEELPKVKPDLLLVDVSLPGMSGIELLEVLQASDVLPPALVVTGHGEAIYRNKALEAGARGFVTKREGAAALLAAIDHVLSASMASFQASQARTCTSSSHRVV